MTTSLPTARLGRTDMYLSRVGFGAWAIGGGGWAYAWGGQDDSESIAAIRAAVESGVNWIDTAAVYGLGHSEEVVAAALAGLPDTDRPYVFTKPNLRPVGLAHPALTCGYLPVGGQLDSEMYSVKCDNPGQSVRYWPHEAQVREHAPR